MQLFITLLITFIWSPFFAHAGLPGIDPAVSKLRDDFAVASVPSLNDLRINKAWDCTQFDARADHNTVIPAPGLLKFRSVGGVIINDGPTLVKAFAFTKEGLNGSYSQSPYQYMVTLRITATAELILEWANMPQERNGAGQAVSLVNPAYFTASYVSCTHAN